MYIVPTAIPVEGVTPGSSPGANASKEDGLTSPFALLLGLLQGGSPQTAPATALTGDELPESDVGIDAESATNGSLPTDLPNVSLVTPPGSSDPAPLFSTQVEEAQSGSLLPAKDADMDVPESALAKAFDRIAIVSRPTPDGEASISPTTKGGVESSPPGETTSKYTGLPSGTTSSSLTQPEDDSALSKLVLPSLQTEAEDAGKVSGDAKPNVESFDLKLQRVFKHAKIPAAGGTSKSDSGPASNVLDVRPASISLSAVADRDVSTARVPAPVAATVERSFPQTEKSAATHNTLAASVRDSGPTVAASTVAPTIHSLDVRVDGAPTPNAPEANAPPKATLENLPQQVIRGLRYLVESGEHTLRIRLVPESLGEVNLEVRSSRDEVSVRMASASPIVREVLQQHLPSLRESLAQDGVHVAKVSVSVDLNQSHAPSEGGRHGFSQSYAHRGPTPQLTHPAPKAETSVTHLRAASHTGALNVYV